MTEKILPETIDFDGAFPRLNRRLRLGVVGGGRISKTQAIASRLSDRWEVVAGVLSSDPAKAKARGEEWYLPEERCYASFEEMAKAENARADGVDAVMITTPNHVHFEACKTFLENGINVLCDKPLTNLSSESLELVTLAEETGCIFGVCYAMSAFPMVRQAKAMVEAGMLGELNQIHVEFMQDWMLTDGIEEAEHVKWRLDPKKSGATSTTGDIGTHAQHLSSFVTGKKISQVSAELMVCGKPKQLEDTVMMRTRYEGGIPGTLMATRVAAGNRGGLRLRVYGNEGGLEWDMENSEQLKFNRFGEADRIISRGQGGGMLPQIERLTRTARGFPEGLLEAWANLYTEFAMAVAARADGRDIPADWLAFPTVDQGAQGVLFVDAAVESNQNDGKWADVKFV